MRQQLSKVSHLALTSAADVFSKPPQGLHAQSVKNKRNTNSITGYHSHQKKTVGASLNVFQLDEQIQNESPIKKPINKSHRKHEDKNQQIQSIIVSSSNNSLIRHTMDKSRMSNNDSDTKINKYINNNHSINNKSNYFTKGISLIKEEDYCTSRNKQPLKDVPISRTTKKINRQVLSSLEYKTKAAEQNIRQSIQQLGLFRSLESVKTSQNRATVNQNKRATGINLSSSKHSDYFTTSINAPQYNQLLSIRTHLSPTDHPLKPLLHETGYNSMRESMFSNPRVKSQSKEQNSNLKIQINHHLHLKNPKKKLLKQNNLSKKSLSHQYSKEELKEIMNDQLTKSDDKSIVQYIAIAGNTTNIDSSKDEVIVSIVDNIECMYSLRQRPQNKIVRARDEINIQRLSQSPTACQTQEDDMMDCEELEEGMRAEQIKNFVKLDQDIKIGSGFNQLLSPLPKDWKGALRWKNDQNLNETKLQGNSDYDYSKETIIVNPVDVEPNPYFQMNVLAQKKLSINTNPKLLISKKGIFKPGQFSPQNLEYAKPSVQFMKKIEQNFNNYQRQQQNLFVFDQSTVKDRSKGHQKAKLSFLSTQQDSKTKICSSRVEQSNSAMAQLSKKQRQEKQKSRDFQSVKANNHSQLQLSSIHQHKISNTSGKTNTQSSYQIQQSSVAPQSVKNQNQQPIIIDYFTALQEQRSRQVQQQQKFMLMKPKRKIQYYNNLDCKERGNFSIEGEGGEEETDHLMSINIQKQEVAYQGPGLGDCVSVEVIENEGISPDNLVSQMHAFVYSVETCQQANQDQTQDIRYSNDISVDLTSNQYNSPDIAQINISNSNSYTIDSKDINLQTKMAEIEDIIMQNQVQVQEKCQLFDKFDQSRPSLSCSSQMSVEQSHSRQSEDIVYMAQSQTSQL
ncbi:UNKNOWN [Stylonychia lemnae]|uniref:Uncharacterized protein n=1 Tax=Stylonychia lemnae TaxID=5949 RepID=A0A078AB18_STYLE|nr:UNKNOWN [Stylonychia lemnae]|eukprot:CDW79066.1 UNKNOWN [Stylonychia lemnae]